MHPLLAAHLCRPIPRQDTAVRPAQNGHAPLLQRLCRAIRHDHTSVLLLQAAGSGLLFSIEHARASAVGKEHLDTIAKAEAAERESVLLCERCGEEGRAARAGAWWGLTLCEECMDVRRGGPYRWAE
ncbi:hypothetical protein HMN09_00996300 [Mycena chlorophos]|uniref:Uncharacterized protein n=1 Tax=Mycena chlorophos TaxID=658473 RepID=A0A8H6SL85_MYCCL|nr:hypothetical protein HMN09_00996300 [Mycena chlorophos]